MKIFVFINQIRCFWLCNTKSGVKYHVPSFSVRCQYKATYETFVEMNPMRKYFLFHTIECAVILFLNVFRL